MKIGIIGFANISYMPYLKYYTEKFDNLEIKYDVIYWNRRNIDENLTENYYGFEEGINDSTAKNNKIIPMLKFRRYAINKIEEHRYDFIVILTTVPGILLNDYLKRNYNKKYIIDIRDYTYEGFFAYKWLLKTIVNKSFFTVISSNGFKEFLPDYDYVLCHNSIVFKNEKSELNHMRGKKERIKISYIGAIGYYEEVIKLINEIANDSRFYFCFYGSGIDEEKIKNYCNDNNIKNTYFQGRYKPEEKEMFYRDTDIIYNAYGNNTTTVRSALSNKLYEALWYKIPILVSRNTEMANMAGKISFVLDFDDKGLANRLFEWYNSIEWNIFEKECEIKIERIEKDNRNFNEKLNMIAAFLK